MKLNSHSPPVPVTYQYLCVDAPTNLNLPPALDHTQLTGNRWQLLDPLQVHGTVTGRATATRTTLFRLGTIIVPVLTRIYAVGRPQMVHNGHVGVCAPGDQRPLGTTAQLPLGPHRLETRIKVTDINLGIVTLGSALESHQVVAPVSAGSSNAQ